MNKKIYLAHPFDKRFEIREKELEFEEKYNIELINPFFDIKTKGVDETKHNDEEIYKQVSDKYKEVVGSCINAIHNSDIIVAYVYSDCFSIGTLQEIIYAKLINKQVYVITNDEKVKGHCWIKYWADGIYSSLDEINLEEVSNKD
ncbi:MAG: nucleoside 2-deoxyribosyltransferase [Candidatus Njordarchaeales archaeon]